MRLHGDQARGEPVRQGRGADGPPRPQQAAARHQGPQRHQPADGRLHRRPLGRRQLAGHRHRHPEEHGLRAGQDRRGAARSRSSRCGWRATSSTSTTGSPAPGRRSRSTPGPRFSPTGSRSGTRSPAAPRRSATPWCGRTGRPETVISGLTDLVLLNSAHSEFHGFPQVEYTVAGRDRRPDPGHRVQRPLGLHRGRQRHRRLGRPFRRYPRADAEEVRHHPLARSAADAVRDGRGGARGVPDGRRDPVLDAEQAPLPGRRWSHFGLSNDNEVFYAADRPYGLIQAAVVRDDAPVDPAAWSGIGGFI